jgi:hypothetical protein
VITARSTYNVKLRINEIIAADKRFQVTILNHTVSPDERVEIAEVRFDASAHESNYLNATIAAWNHFLSYDDIA